MTPQEQVERGRASEADGDFESAEAAYRSADRDGEREGSIYLGLLLRRREDFDGAFDALSRAERLGHPEAASCIGNMLWDRNDTAAARAAFERALAAGSRDAPTNLGLLLAQLGETEGALGYLVPVESGGDTSVSWAVGRLLDDRGDRSGALEAYRRGSDGGDASAAYALGSALYGVGDRAGARSAFSRAVELGHATAASVMQMLDIEEQQVSASASVAAFDDAAQRYGSACNDVLAAANECVEVANRAIGARVMVEQRPQHEISIATFRRRGEEAEREFGIRYRRFSDVSTYCREVAAELLVIEPEIDEAEIRIFSELGEQVMDTVATAKAILLSTYGPSPQAFMQGVSETNEIIARVGDGNIYKPPPPIASGEQVCPWCAETIKAAAIVCRYCGRGIRV